MDNDHYYHLTRGPLSENLFNDLSNNRMSNKRLWLILLLIILLVQKPMNSCSPHKTVTFDPLSEGPFIDLQADF